MAQQIFFSSWLVTLFRLAAFRSIGLSPRLTGRRPGLLQGRISLRGQKGLIPLSAPGTFEWAPYNPMPVRANDTRKGSRGSDHE